MLERATIAQKELYRQTAQTPAGSDVLRVGGGVLPPSVLSKSEPEYSQEARFAKYAGTVLVYLEIRPDGIPQNIRIVKGLGLGLDESAIASIEKWRFRPGTKDGVPVTVAAHVEVNFRLM
jgi:protein TonB